ncbi:MAG TPA: tRNA pseudouridine(55) synthase TruB [Clostridiales bacterium]|nr:tRNA pseudouridine(55) synthase TruB [Clostridiales bacterium]HPV00986.1 tRNA pseudouridine(55) synthase TruB [Clostridiales bacterium]
MDGILNILKPPGMTSFDVVAYLRGLTGVRKIGHAGTLDPMAAGVLPVCVGRATKAVEFLMEKDKTYRAEVTLGVVTDTQDTTGTVLARKKPEVSDNDIIDAVASFRGKYMQLPPMYSAVRVNGKKLYQLAREGIETERSEREVEIYSAEVLDICRKDGIRVLLEVSCSKGTYIRTLCADIGDVLGCGGCMSFLLRLKAGPFSISDSVTLEELSLGKEKGTLAEMMMDVDRAFENFCSCVLDEVSAKKFMNGMQVRLATDRINMTDGTDTEAGGLIRVYGNDGRFVALGTVIHRENGNYLKARKFF